MGTVLIWAMIVLPMSADLERDLTHSSSPFPTRERKLTGDDPQTSGKPVRVSIVGDVGLNAETYERDAEARERTEEYPGWSSRSPVLRDDKIALHNIIRGRSIQI